MNNGKKIFSMILLAILTGHFNPLYAYESLAPIYGLLLSSDKDNNGSTTDLPLWQWKQIEYVGGFRVMGGKVGEGEHSILGYSPGPFFIDEANSSIFMVSMDYEQGFGEINLPQLTNSQDPHDFIQADTVIQQFQDIYGTERDVTGISSYFRVTGLHKIGNQLLVNYLAHRPTW